MFDTPLHDYFRPSDTAQSRALIDRMRESWRAEAQAAAGRLGAIAELFELRRAERGEHEDMVHLHGSPQTTPHLAIAATNNKKATTSPANATPAQTQPMSLGKRGRWRFIGVAHCQAHRPVGHSWVKR